MEDPRATKRKGGYTQNQVGKLLPKGQVGVNVDPELFGGKIASRCWYDFCKVNSSVAK